MFFQSEDHSATGVASLISQPKSVVIHTSRAFHSPQLDVDQCTNILTALLYHLYQGEIFTSEESSQLFFACTKLFQSNDLFMRRLVYLLIRELNPGSDESLIVINCLSKDVNSSSQELCRGNAVRLLFSLVSDEGMLQNIEKLLTQTLVDRSPLVIISSLLAAQHVYGYAPDALRKWKLSIQTLLTHSSAVVRYHATSLCLKMVYGDYHSTVRLVSQLEKGIVESSSSSSSFGSSALLTSAGTLSSSSAADGKPLSVVLLQRTISRLMTQHAQQQQQQHRIQRQQQLSYPVDWLEFLRDTVDPAHRLSTPTTQLESARIIIHHFLYTTNTEYERLLSFAIATLVGMLSSSSSSQHATIRKFAAMRTLSSVAQTHPHLLTQHAKAFEPLLKSSNKTLIMLAISMLLRFDTDQIDSFLTSLEQILGDSNDETKLVMIANLREFVGRRPDKLMPVVSFLCLLLKDENRFIVKNAVVTCIHDILVQLRHSAVGSSAAKHTPTPTPECTFTLDLLAEYIEDSEYALVTIRAINMIGKFAHHTEHPSKYIRFLYNRTILETASVRAAALSAIMRIAVMIPRLRRSIVVLFAHVVDFDDEVRDRARLFVELLQSMLFVVRGGQNKSLGSTSDDHRHPNGVYQPLSILLDALPAKYEQTPHEAALPSFVALEQYKQLPLYPQTTTDGGESMTSPWNSTTAFPSVDDLEHSLVQYLQNAHNVDVSDAQYIPHRQYIAADGASHQHHAGAITPPEQSFQQYQHRDLIASPEQPFTVEEHLVEAPVTVKYIANLSMVTPSDGTPGAPLPSSSSIGASHQGAISPSGATSTAASAISHGITESSSLSAISDHVVSLFPEDLQQVLTKHHATVSQTVGTNTPVLFNPRSLFSSSTTTTGIVATAGVHASAQRLTSQSGEFPTTVQHYMFNNNILVCHFTIENNFQESVLRNVEVAVSNLEQFAQPRQTPSGVPLPPIFQLVYCNAIPELAYSQCASIFMTFVVNEQPAPRAALLPLLHTPLNGSLVYLLDMDGDVEHSTYQLNPMVFPCHAVIRAPLSIAAFTTHHRFDFRQAWDGLGASNEAMIAAQLAYHADYVSGAVSSPTTTTAFQAYIYDALLRIQQSTQLVPSDPAFRVEGLPPTTKQVLVNLVATVFDDMKPSQTLLAGDSDDVEQTSQQHQQQLQTSSVVLARCGFLLRDENTILIKAVVRASPPAFAKYISTALRFQ